MGALGAATIARELGVVGGLCWDLGEDAGSGGRFETVDDPRVEWRWQDPVAPNHAMLATFSLHFWPLLLRFNLYETD